MIRQAVKIPLTDKTQVTCGGYTVQQGGIGAGSLYLSSQHNVSPTHWLGTMLELGHKSKLAFSCGTSDDSDTINAPRSLQVTNGAVQWRNSLIEGISMFPCVGRVESSCVCSLHLVLHTDQYGSIVAMIRGEQLTQSLTYSGVCLYRHTAPWIPNKGWVTRCPLQRSWILRQR